MIHLFDILFEILNKNALLYLGWINRNNFNIKVIDIQPDDETETHNNYLIGLPPEWRNERDVNLARWRYNKRTNTVYWWEFNRPSEEEKKQVGMWIQKNLNKSIPIHKIIPLDRKSAEFFDSHSI